MQVSRHTENSRAAERAAGARRIVLTAMVPDDRQQATEATLAAARALRAGEDDGRVLDVLHALPVSADGARGRCVLIVVIDMQDERELRHCAAELAARVDRADRRLLDVQWAVARRFDEHEHRR